MVSINTRRCVFCSDLFRPRCRCGLTKYAMRRRTLREHRLELRMLWDFLEECGLAFEAKEFLVGTMGVDVRRTVLCAHAGRAERLRL